MTNKILCCGCSFTKRTNTHVDVSYCDFLGEERVPAINIGQGGSGIGISLLRVERFLKDPCEHLTHFVFQVPSPARQPIKISDDLSEDYLKRFRCIVDSLPFNEDFENDEGIWSCLLNGTDVKKIESIFFDKPKYYDLSIKLIDTITKKLLSHYPKLKIVLLRYEKTNCPLIREFSKVFYKKTLKKYCKDRNFQYVYQNNFETEFFRKKGYTYDETHPNKTGAKVIADKLKEYL